MIESVGEVIGKSFEKCMKADEKGHCHRSFMCARVLLVISKPLRQGGRIHLGDGDEIASGIPRHTLSECLIVLEGNQWCVGELRYGDWLRATSTRPCLSSSEDRSRRFQNASQHPQWRSVKASFPLLEKASDPETIWWKVEMHKIQNKLEKIVKIM
ncbi:hypothetical protein L484_016073 [Morus notabilis]|uniref:Uncharacterized protein n=1 Tax=Morus notabilis TaxID=981085 RepID=W9SDL2_9ROSA|nr:hypothetical protein L484_016073 [Morus notabilis]